MQFKSRLLLSTYSLEVIFCLLYLDIDVIVSILCFYIYIYKISIYSLLYIRESALIIFPSLFLLSSCLILKKHEKICSPSSLLGMPGSTLGGRNVHPVCQKLWQCRQRTGFRHFGLTVCGLGKKKGKTGRLEQWQHVQHILDCAFSA